MKIVVLESPFAGRNSNLAQRAVNEAYLEACKRVALQVCEIPIASDLGWSNGMVAAQKRYIEAGIPWTTRTLGPDWMRGVYDAKDFGGSARVGST